MEPGASTPLRRQKRTHTAANPEGAMSGHFLARRVRPAGCGTTPDDEGTLPERWLLTGWRPGQDDVLAAEPSA